MRDDWFILWSEQVYEAGRHARMQGRNIEQNPYKEPGVRQMLWYEGWRDVWCMTEQERHSMIAWLRRTYAPL